MSHSITAVAFKKASPEHLKKVKAYQACVDAGVKVPSELEQYFNYEPPDAASLVEAVGKKQLLQDGIIVPYTADMRDGFEVVVDKIPTGYTRIRIFAMY